MVDPFQKGFDVNETKKEVTKVISLFETAGSCAKHIQYHERTAPCAVGGPERPI